MMNNENEDATNQDSVKNATKDECSENANMGKPVETVSDQTDIPAKAKNDASQSVQKHEKSHRKTNDNKPVKSKTQKKGEKGNKCKTPDIKSRDDGPDDNETKTFFKYNKRTGTGAIVGFLYKSHILTLILHRSLKREMDFVLGFSVDEIGSLNEICYRFRHENHKKSVVVFIKTKYSGDITEENLNNPKNDCSLLNCFLSFLLLEERFENDESDAMFEGKFNDIAPYFVIYTPNQSKLKVCAVSEDDKIFTSKVNDMIQVGENNKIFKVSSSVNDLMCKLIEYIGKTIVAYATSDIRDINKTKEEIKRVLTKYYHFLIPDVIQINELNCCGEFNELLYGKSDNCHINLLKEVLFEEILKKLKVNDEEACTNIQTILTNDCTADLLSTLIGNVVKFDEYTNKLVFIPEVSDHIKKISIDKIQLNKSIADEAFVIAGEKALKDVKINLTNTDLKDVIANQKARNRDASLKKVLKNEKQAAEQFLNYLYIYAEQGTERVGKDKKKVKPTFELKLKEEIADSPATFKNASVMQYYPESVFIKFHCTVQKWMLLTEDSYYLTNNNCDFLNEATNDIDHLNVLNFKCIVELQGYSLKFTKESMSSLFFLADIQSRTNIITNNVLLTSIKIMQYFSDKNCSYVDFDDVYIMEDTEFKKLLQAVNETNINTLVVIYKTENKSIEKLNQIINRFSKNIVLVSKCQFKDFATNYDEIKGLEDIDIANEMLNYEITVQGHEFEIGNIISENNRNVINAEILSKIIKNEKIEVGQPLSNQCYDELKDCFIERKISEYDYDNTLSVVPSSYHVHERQLSSLKDINEKVVFITAEPGMGKSTLLTHLSVKMKESYPKTWIVRINLLNCCDDFDNWQKDETYVSITESMHLVCKTELNNAKVFSLVENDVGDLVLIEEELDQIASLHLKLLINCFNEGNIIFLFDGFDEICPDYEDVALEFMKNLVSVEIMGESGDSHSNQIWITSRPYNAIKETLVNTLDITPFHLRRISTGEQYQFYKKYWETRIKLEELDSKQFDNVTAFFEYMNQYRVSYELIFKIPTTSSVPLRLMHEAAVDYFRDKLTSSTLHLDKETLLNKWISLKTMQKIDDCFSTDEQYQEGLQLAGIPLHMKMYADFFVSEIKDTKNPTKNWTKGVHTFEFYNKFLEIKLKKIRFEEKGAENVSTSFSLTTYDETVEEVTEEHKQLAFYAFFHDKPRRMKKVLQKKQWMQIKTMMERIKNAQERTGLIDRIHKGVPRFVHLVFAEYYAVEFVADMLKMDNVSDDQIRRQIDFVINCLLKSSLGIMTVFNHKLKNDEELRRALEKDGTRKCIFDVWMDQHGKTEKYRVYYGEEERKIESSIEGVLENELVETAWILIKSIEGNLNSSNIEKFVDFINRDFFVLALKYDELIKYVLDIIRDIDSSLIVKIYNICDLPADNNLQLDNESFMMFLRERHTHTDFEYYDFD